MNGENSWTQVDVELADNIPGVVDTGFARAFMAFAPKIVEAIRNEENSIQHSATFDDGLQVQRVLDAARESDRSGAEVSINAGS